MKKILLGILIILVLSSPSRAGKINTVKIKAKDGGQVTVKEGSSGCIKSIKTEKDDTSHVRIDRNTDHCKDSNNICKPQ